MPLPAGLAATLERAWSDYRANRVAAADSGFRVVAAACPADPGTLVGQGYVALRRGEVDRARTAFAAALERLPASYDALTGSGMAAYRAGDAATARARFRETLRLFPGDSLSRWYLERLGVTYSETPLPPIDRPAALRVDARAGHRIFEVPEAGGWRPFWIKGVNLGAALPGKHPSEFPPDDGTYDRWLELTAAMGANTVRVYTIHPPHFYRALERWNRANPARPLWLVHGVWTELPPGKLEERYDDPAWRGEFRSEGRRVVDLLHGRAAIDPRPGHAAGVYLADVSRWVLGYIIGREWEPYSVVEYSRLHPDRREYRGRFVTATGGHATEAWLAEECDQLLQYEVDRFNTIRPIAYTNWPTLDPLRHPTESTREEEARLRRWRMPEEPKEFDNDAIGLDATRMRPTAANPAGTFASYHAYPYYPDFMVLDPGYGAARSPEGPSAYYGYLRELVAHHDSMPVVISEYGVPSSRGTAHWQPQGWHHGGHSERAQAEIDARLTRDIHAAGAAGAILFALIDEWFKKNWVVIDFEVPAERNRLWLNVLDAEQNYGIIAMRPGPADSAITIDGRLDDWGERGRLAEPVPGSAAPAPLRIEEFRVHSDEAYLYLALRVGAIDWSRGRYLIGIDTHRPDLGAGILPRTGTACPAGLELVVDLGGPDRSELLVDRPSNLYRAAPLGGSRPPRTMQVFNRPWRSVAHADPRWDTLVVETNRIRIGRDGTIFPAITDRRNRLRHGLERDDSLVDWYPDPATGTIELRLGWGMLQVLDPSSRLVLHGMDRAGMPAGVGTDGFRFVLQSYRPEAPSAGGTVLGCGGATGRPFRYRWETWETPRWHPRVKPVFEAMRATFTALEPGPAPRAPARR